MPPSNIRKSRRQRKRRGRGYLLGTLALIIIVAVGWYVYASAQSANAIVYAELNTSHGLIEVELYQKVAPRTVANFVRLAKEGFYDDLVWHRIATGFVIQTGDPLTKNGGGDRSAWGTGGSSQTVPLEIDGSLHNSASYLGMARGADRSSGSSQFYINLRDNTSLDGDYTVFGRVTSGMDFARAIGNLPVDTPPDGRPLDPLPFLISVTISNSP